ncbi:MAG: Repressor of nif and glnA expression [Thermodesulfobacterium sp.]|uniref:Repressor of nif and glnA expression n=1 Tax=Candidatus Thermodesulfobacterium syntrophicum TaxID=3060442 RepID=A0AAE3P606_9BACT|nr:Repressor of nif and glnA expression [Candidatus Thermodesulfobacterium syntrophicum]
MGKRADKNFETKRKLLEILRILGESDMPLGARAISVELQRRGFNIKERTVRYHLSFLDAMGFTKKHGKKGRTITEQGLRELEEASLEERLGSVKARIEELIFLTTFDPLRREGNVIVNVALIDKRDFEKIVGLFEELSAYVVSHYVKVIDERERVGGLHVPPGKVAVANICSITIDGVLVKNGIPVEVRYSGIVQISSGKPQRFIDVISYEGTSVDPTKVFVSRKITSVCDALAKGTGRVIANYREIPAIALESAAKVIKSLKAAGITGVITFGTGLSVLGVPLLRGRVGIPVYAGVNAFAAAEERGIKTETLPMHTVMPFKELKML